MKVCARCRRSLPFELFNKSSRNHDGRHAYCRECQHDYYLVNAVHHGENVRRNARIRKERMRKLAFEFLREGCVDCGNRDIRVLEFDHVRGTKVSGISALISEGRGIDVLREEIAKCDVRCRNCHAIATLERLGSSWHDRFPVALN